MYRTKDRARAVELRLKGWSYSQIQNEIKASNGTINYWLKDYPLTKEQKDKIFGKRDLWIEKFRETMKLRKENKLREVYLSQKQYWGRMSKRDLMIMGVGLYWGEGQKGGSSVCVANTDPDVIKFVLLWLNKCFGVERESKKIRVYLHLYSDMDIEKSISFWQDCLKINRSQFARPYIKQSTRSGLTYKGFGHGTCQLTVADVKIKQKIMADIKIFSELPN